MTMDPASLTHTHVLGWETEGLHMKVDLHCEVIPWSMECVGPLWPQG